MASHARCGLPTPAVTAIRPSGPTTMPAYRGNLRRQPTCTWSSRSRRSRCCSSTVWMVMADHLRPWKEVQREFQEVERDKLKASEKEKLEEQKHEVQGPDRGDRREDQGGQGGRRRARRARFARSTSELSKLDGTVGAARHPEAVQEGRARQQAQPLRRHDRPGRGARGARPTSPATSSRPRRSSPSSPRNSKTAKAELKAKKDEKEELLGNVDELKKEQGAADARGRPRRSG